MRRRLLRLLAKVSLGTCDAHAPHHAAAKRIRRLGWSLRRACGGVCKNADGDGLLGRYETLYKENKAKYDEEMKTYKNSDSYKEFAAKEDSDASSGDEDEKPGKEKKKKAKKDPNAPKQAGSAYILFSQAERENVRTHDCSA